MKKRLPELTVATALVAVVSIVTRDYWASKPPDAQANPAAVTNAPPVDSQLRQPTTGDQLVEQARLQLERRHSVTARIRYQASVDDHSLAGFGGYWQQGRGDELQLRFELRVNHEDTSLLQVSDGRFIWTDQRLPSGRMIDRLDLLKVRTATSRTKDEFDDIATTRVDLTPPEPDLALRTGGLPTLLMVISDCFAFTPPQSMRWTPAQPLEGLGESLPVFAVVGRWKPEVLALFLPEGGGVNALPDRLPQEVLLLFGQADLFPYRIEFRQLLPQAAASDAPAQSAAFQLSSDPLMLLELSAVSFDSQVPAGQFQYSAGDANWDDRTADYIESLRRQREQRLARRDRATQH
jgi:hypothetical protein